MTDWAPSSTGRLGRFEILLAGILCAAAVDARVRLHACLPAHSVAQTPQTSFLLPLPRSFPLAQPARHEKIAENHARLVQNAHPATAARRLIVVAVDRRPATIIYR